MATRFVVLVTLSSLLIFSLLSTPSFSSQNDDDDEEDLSFLDDGANDAASSHSHHDLDPSEFDFPDGGDSDEDDDVYGNYDDFQVPSEFENDDEDSTSSNPAFDEKDVVVLKEGNFSEFVEGKRYVMVEFYAPWCGHCKALAPEYAAAATELKAEGDVALAKVDATEESEVAEKYGVQGYPTVFFFIDGVHKPYPGQRTKDAIVTWIKKKIGPGIYNITTTEDAEKILTSDSENKVVLGFLDSLLGSSDCLIKLIKEQNGFK